MPTNLNLDQSTAVAPAQLHTPPAYQVKNVAIGTLPVKTIVPITAKTYEQAHTIANNPADKPIIATIRTHNEGGNITVSDSDYASIYSDYLAQPFMQLLDIEIFRDKNL